MLIPYISVVLYRLQMLLYALFHLILTKPCKVKVNSKEQETGLQVLELAESGFELM